MIVNELRKVLANTFMLYFQAHSAHWNVEGMLFSPLHEFFGTIYQEVHAAVDPIAEHIRALNHYAPVSIKEMLLSETIGDMNGVYEAKALLEQLIVTNDLVLSSLYNARVECEAANEAGVLNFLEERIDYHDKLAWQLKAHLK